MGQWLLDDGMPPSVTFTVDFVKLASDSLDGAAISVKETNR
jgi:hypothetical protein